MFAGNRLHWLLIDELVAPLTCGNNQNNQNNRLLLGVQMSESKSVSRGPGVGSNRKQPVAAGCRLQVARPSLKVAKRMGINRNHHVRLWCECMNNPMLPVGTWSERTQAEVMADPRRLGSFDHFAVVDVRDGWQAVEQAFDNHRAAPHNHHPGGLAYGDTLATENVEASLTSEERRF